MGYYSGCECMLSIFIKLNQKGRLAKIEQQTVVMFSNTIQR